MRLVVLAAVGLAIGGASGAMIANASRDASLYSGKSPITTYRKQHRSVCATLTAAVNRRMSRTARDQWRNHQVQPDQVADAYTLILTDFRKLDSAGSRSMPRFRTALATKRDRLRSHPREILGKIGDTIDRRPAYSDAVNENWFKLVDQRLIPSDRTCPAVPAATELITYPAPYDTDMDRRLPRAGRFRDLTPEADERSASAASSMGPAGEAPETTEAGGGLE